MKKKTKQTPSKSTTNTNKLLSPTYHCHVVLNDLTSPKDKKILY
jgi:hypothetical protein